MRIWNTIPKTDSVLKINIICPFNHFHERVAYISSNDIHGCEWPYHLLMGIQKLLQITADCLTGPPKDTQKPPFTGATRAKCPVWLCSLYGHQWTCLSSVKAVLWIVFDRSTLFRSHWLHWGFQSSISYMCSVYISYHITMSQDTCCRDTDKWMHCLHVCCLVPTDYLRCIFAHQDLAPYKWNIKTKFKPCCFGCSDFNCTVISNRADMLFMSYVLTQIFIN